MIEIIMKNLAEIIELSQNLSAEETSHEITGYIVSKKTYKGEIVKSAIGGFYAIKSKNKLTIVRKIGSFLFKEFETKGKAHVLPLGAFAKSKRLFNEDLVFYYKQTNCKEVYKRDLKSKSTVKILEVPSICSTSDLLIKLKRKVSTNETEDK